MFFACQSSGNIDQGDGISHNPRNCNRYLKLGGKNFKRIFLGLQEACQCEDGVGDCKYLYYPPGKGIVICKETTPRRCKRYANKLYNEWETVPKEEDKYCRAGYEISRTLAVSCNPM